MCYFIKCKGYYKICICIGFLNLFLDILIDYVILVVFEFRKRKKCLR